MPPTDKSAPVATTVPGISAPLAEATTIMSAAPITSATPQAPLMTATFSNTSYGLMLKYPADWQKEELSEVGLRDYGRTTLNIVNLYSPDVEYLSERYNKSQPNPDKINYTTLSIDIDPEPVTDFERYFNLATLAFQNTYGSITITKHNSQLSISGYKAYQMDFDTATIRASYIFVNVDSTIYVFAFRNPSLYSSEVDEIMDSVKIVSAVTPQKHR